MTVALTLNCATPAHTLPESNCQPFVSPILMSIMDPSSKSISHSDVHEIREVPPVHECRDRS
jgi:hypothetical protein